MEKDLIVKNLFTFLFSGICIILFILFYTTTENKVVAISKKLDTLIENVDPTKTDSLNKEIQLLQEEIMVIGAELDSVQLKNNI